MPSIRNPHEGTARMVVVLIRHPGESPARHGPFPDPAEGPETILGGRLPAEAPSSQVPTVLEQSGKPPRLALAGNGLQVAQPFLHPWHRAQSTLPVPVEAIDLPMDSPGGDDIEQVPGPHRSDLRLRIAGRHVGEAGKEHPGDLFHGRLRVRLAPVTLLSREGNLVDQKAGHETVRVLWAGHFHGSGESGPEDKAREHTPALPPHLLHSATAWYSPQFPAIPDSGFPGPSRPDPHCQRADSRLVSPFPMKDDSSGDTSPTPPPTGTHDPEGALHDPLYQWWQRYGGALIAAAVLVLAGTGLYFGVQAYRGQQETRREAAYLTALNSGELATFAEENRRHAIGGLAALEVGQERYAEGNWEEAVRFLALAADALEDHPVQEKARLDLAVARYRAGETAKAETLLSAMADEEGLYPATRAEALYLLAIQQWSEGRTDALTETEQRLEEIDRQGEWLRSLRSLVDTVEPPAPVPSAATGSSSGDD